MDQNAPGQSDRSIFKSTISPEQNDEKALLKLKFIEIKSWLKNIGVSMVKNRCIHCGHRTLKLAVF